MTFADKVLNFYKGLELTCRLPSGVEVMNPYMDTACMKVCTEFYNKFYNDQDKRHLILGINPGRYGAGITGIPFTDPIKLEKHPCKEAGAFSGIRSRNDLGLRWV
jgi:hypothetical protein